MKHALAFEQDLNNMLHFGIKLIWKQRTFCAEETQKGLQNNNNNKKRLKRIQVR